MKITALIASCVCAFALAACGSSAPKQQTGTETPPVTTQPSANPADGSAQ